MRKNLPFRAWFYFRMGYATYLAFMMAIINTMVTVYYLAIDKVPVLETVFPSFSIWTIFIAFTVGPLGVLIGWLHLKRTPAFRSEAEVAAEANPYFYKLPPGYWREALIPAILELLTLNLKLLNKETLSESEVNSLKDLQKKLQLLIYGGFIG
ncbi:MAG: hypothetical protein ACRD5H_18565, partial [Nitrososphaerales archaeon]